MDAERTCAMRSDRLALADNCRVVSSNGEFDTSDSHHSDRQTIAHSSQSNTRADKEGGTDHEQLSAIPTLKVVRPRQYLQPPRYDGSFVPESFLAQFSNCATFNRCTSEEQLAFLRNTLDGIVAQNLCNKRTKESSQATRRDTAATSF